MSEKNEWKQAEALRESLLWTASSLAAVGKEQDVIVLEGRKRTIGEILDEANAALSQPDAIPPAPTSHPIPTGATGEDTDSFDDPSTLAAVADALAEDASNDNAQFAAAYLYRQAKAIIDAPAAGDALDRAEMFRHQLAYERAKNERLLAILVGIHGLTLPAPIEVDGKTYVFTPPEAVEILRGLSDRIRAIPDEIAAIAQQKGEA